MTAIKQTSVCSEKHLARLRDYLSWDRDKALAHGTQNIIDDDRWFQEMADTRAAMGHDRPGKAGAKCTYMQHQILGFLPDECDLNGGKMTPELCMRYAREYVAERYPNQEVVMVLHRERCRADATDRYAVHLGINRSDLETGRRLDEGPARKAAASRVKTVRTLDERYGLRQLERGKANSRVHARQPGTEERDMARKGQAERSETPASASRSPAESRRSGACATAPTGWASLSGGSSGTASSSPGRRAGAPVPLPLEVSRGHEEGQRRKARLCRRPLDWHRRPLHAAAG